MAVYWAHPDRINAPIAKTTQTHIAECLALWRARSSRLLFSSGVFICFSFFDCLGRSPLADTPSATDAGLAAIAEVDAQAVSLCRIRTSPLLPALLRVAFTTSNAFSADISLHVNHEKANGRRFLVSACMAQHSFNLRLPTVCCCLCDKNSGLTKPAYGVLLNKAKRRP